MKNQRQREILDIISTRDIETQEQLLACLRERGITTTQTTVSRDIRQLHLVKEQTAGGAYRYAASLKKEESDLTWRLQRIFRQGVISADVAQNIVVLRTMPGLASAAGATIDNMEVPNMVGCLAGNDTVMLVMRSDETAEEFCQQMRLTLLA